MVFCVSRQLRKAPVRCSKVSMEPEAGTLQPLELIRPWGSRGWGCRCSPQLLPTGAVWPGAAAMSDAPHPPGPVVTSTGFPAPPTPIPEGLVRPDALGPAVPPSRSGRLLHRCCSVWKSAGSVPSSLTGLSPTFVPFQGQGREEVVWKVVALPFSTNLPGLINQPGIRTICTFYLFQIRMERAFSYCFGSIDHPLTRTVSTGEECIRPA